MELGASPLHGMYKVSLYGFKVSTYAYGGAVLVHPRDFSTDAHPDPGACASLENIQHDIYGYIG